MNLYTFPTGASPHPAIALDAEQTADWLLGQKPTRRTVQARKALEALQTLGKARAEGAKDDALLDVAYGAVGAVSHIVNRSVWGVLREAGRVVFVGYVADEVYKRG